MENMEKINDEKINDEIDDDGYGYDKNNEKPSDMFVPVENEDIQDSNNHLLQQTSLLQQTTEPLLQQTTEKKNSFVIFYIKPKNGYGTSKKIIGKIYNEPDTDTKGTISVYTLNNNKRYVPKKFKPKDDNITYFNEGDYIKVTETVKNTQEKKFEGYIEKIDIDGIIVNQNKHLYDNELNKNAKTITKIIKNINHSTSQGGKRHTKKILKKTAKKANKKTAKKAKKTAKKANKKKSAKKTKRHR